MINRTKELIIRYLVSTKKPRWENGDKLKVVITVSRYFTVERWNTVLRASTETEIKNWDIVYCRNKIELYRHVKEADICFLFGAGTYLIKHLNSPKMIYFPVLGLDFLNKYVLPEKITLEQPPPFSAQSIAEYCVAMSIILTRNLHHSFSNQYNQKWQQTNIIPESIISITQCKIGILGLGKVGKVIAENFNKMGCKVIGCDKVALQEDNILSAYFNSDKLYEFLNYIDILIIALPLNNSTKHLIDKTALHELGTQKYLINVSRGEIIDEKALIHALSTNAIKGAALDVFENEPLSGNSKLYQCRNAILTPHIAGNLNLFVNEIQLDFIYKALHYKKNV